MLEPWKVANVVAALPLVEVSECEPPPYHGGAGTNRAFLAVSSMKDHTTDEANQLQEGLGETGYRLYGHGYEHAETDVRKILEEYYPQTLVLQDKREWLVKPGNFRDRSAKFFHVCELANHDHIFKLTVLKDAHQEPLFHKLSAEEIKAHGWITYYHPKTVKRLAPYVREKHLVRTTHSVDASLVPPYSPERKGILLSGAISGVYPLRRMIERKAARFVDLDILPHPGYHRNGSNTPEFLKILSKYKVSICTSSCFGYTLRKLIESTACGCRVLTNLPIDDVMPEIDENFVRIPNDIIPRQLADVFHRMIEGYDPERQRHFAQRALQYYDYRAVGARLADNIEALRLGYNK